MNRNLVILLAGALAGCSSLVSDPCMQGFHLEGGACMTVDKTHGSGDMTGTMGGPDAQVAVTGVDAMVDGPPPLVCALPTTQCGDACVSLDDDPFNCGHCGRECQSGICSSGTCLGDIAGHIIVVGHDYVSSDPAMDRVIANAITTGWVPGPIGAGGVRVGYWRGTATLFGWSDAATRGLAQTSHGAWFTEIPALVTGSTAEVDTVVIEPQVGDGAAAVAAGAAAAPELTQFLVASHDVVVIETSAGVGYRFLHGAGLLDLAPPIDVSASQVSLVAPGDSIAQGVVSPYLAKAGSVAFPGAAHAVVTDSAGDAVVIHATY